MTKIKMCGLFRDEDISFVNEILPEYIGFVFYKKSHRYVDKERAGELKAMLDARIKAVGVFVNEDISFIKSLVEDKVIDVVQLHGSEDEAYIKELRSIPALKDIPIIKAVQIKSKEDFESWRADTGKLDSLVDYYLLDSGMGSGSSFDWNMIKGLDKPIFLAGGLGPQNIASAIEMVTPFAVDVSSGIETDKHKDFEKMKLFAQNVRG